MSEPLFREYHSTFGKLAFANIANDASAAIGALLKKAEVNREPIRRLATELPYLFGVSSLTELEDPLYVRTEPMLICFDAMKSGLGFQPSSLVPDIVAELEVVRVRIEKLGGGATLSVRQLRNLRLFCVALAGELLDRVSLPDPPAGSMRVMG